MKLLLDNDYTFKIRDIKDIVAKDSFLTLDLDVRECQDDEVYDDCVTRNHLNTLTSNCHCLPFHLRLSEKVLHISKLLNTTLNIISGTSLYFRQTKMCKKY